MNKFFYAAVILLSALVSQAQSSKGDFTIAPHAGFTISSFTTSNDSSPKIRPSLSLGAHLDYYLSDRWSIRSGLLYAPHGAEDSFDNTDKINYLALPLNANWHFGYQREWYVNLGFKTLYVLNAKTEQGDGQEIDIEEIIQTIDFGINYGLGYKFRLNETTMFFAELQNYRGVVNILKIENDGVKLRNAATSLNLGAVIQL